MSELSHEGAFRLILQGHLSEAERLVLSSHLRTCPACRRSIAADSALQHHLVLQKPKTRPSPRFTAVYMESAARRSRRSLIMKPIYAVGGAIALALFVLAGWFIVRANSGTTTLEPVPVETAEIVAPAAIPTETALPPTDEPTPTDQPPPTEAPTEVPPTLVPTEIPPTKAPTAEAEPIVSFATPTKVPVPTEPDMALWSKKAALPVDRYALSASEVDGIIYVLGGISDPARVDAFDPATNTWSRKADMPTPRNALSAVTLNGKLYAIGGRPGSSVSNPSLATVEMYDPATDTWTRKADMPTARDFLTTAVVDGQIYAIGGSSTEGFEKYRNLRTVEAYDPTTDTWSSKSNLNRARDSATATVVDGKIYVLGGWAPYEEVYDPATDTWTKITPMPITTASAVTGVVDGKIYIFGGVSDWGLAGSSIIFGYDPAADAWEALAAMPFNATQMASATVDGVIYIIGGTASDYPPHPPHLNSVWAYQP